VAPAVPSLTEQVAPAVASVTEQVAPAVASVTEQVAPAGVTSVTEQVISTGVTSVTQQVIVQTAANLPRDLDSGLPLAADQVIAPVVEALPSAPPVTRELGAGPAPIADSGRSQHASNSNLEVGRTDSHILQTDGESQTPLTAAPLDESVEGEVRATDAIASLRRVALTAVGLPEPGMDAGMLALPRPQSAPGASGSVLPAGITGSLTTSGSTTLPIGILMALFLLVLFNWQSIRLQTLKIPAGVIPLCPVPPG
jgi:hypothetical protein